MIKWFAMLDNDEVRYLGEHATFCDADSVSPGNTVWIWDEESFKDHSHDVTRAISEAGLYS